MGICLTPLPVAQLLRNWRSVRFLKEDILYVTGDFEK